VELNYLLDTNIILYYLGGKLKQGLPNGKFIVSFVTEIELLSYPGLAINDEQTIRRFLEKLQIVGLSQEIKEKTISLRKTARLKTPDALIAATAMCFDCCLLTNDTHFQRLEELRCKTLPTR